ncbi:MAG: alpha/beta hydrolase-fold protein [Eubacteriales bacterium]|nr:alpha/beta hydrolase-fold protein [Eubacteriales bacterium]
MSGKIQEYGQEYASAVSEYVIATSGYLAEIDAKVDALKTKILGNTDIPEFKGTAYYVSNDGDDKNDGKSPDKAWATLNKVNNMALEKGDAVFFERGGLWRGQVKTKAGVAYSAYGEGEKPRIYGSDENAAQKDKWILTDIPNVYVYDRVFASDVGLIVFDEGNDWAVKKVLSDNPAVLGQSWNADTLIESVNDLANDLEFTFNSDKSFKGGGTDGKIYLYSEKGNPGERFGSIEIGYDRHIFWVYGDDVHIDNLCIKYTGGCGIFGNTLKGLHVTNCEVGWIGGSIMAFRDNGRVARYGNAINVNANSEDYLVDHCYVYEVYDAGISHQCSWLPSVYMKNVTYSNNLIEHCVYAIEYFLSGAELKEGIMSDITFKGNICRFTGYGWGDQRPNKDEAAHIKSWSSQNPSERFIIEDNIFDRSKYMMLHIASSEAESLPVMQDNTYIQHVDAEFGRFGTGSPALMRYDGNVVNFIRNAMSEKNADIRYALNEDTTRIPYRYLKQVPTEFIRSYDYTAKDGTTLPFKVILPDGYDPSEKYPLLLYLHWQHQRGDDNMSQISSESRLIERLFDESDSEKRCIILAPQCPKDAMWVDTPLSDGNYSMDEVGESRYLAAVAALIKDIGKEFGIDERRVYTAGYSMGAYGVWDIAVRHPGIFAAIIPVAGAGDPLGASKLKNTAVWVFHSETDYTVDVADARNMAAALETSGADFRYTEYNNIISDCWDREDLLSWLFEQRLD